MGQFGFPQGGMPQQMMMGMGGPGMGHMSGPMMGGGPGSMMPGPPLGMMPGPPGMPGPGMRGPGMPLMRGSMGFPGPNPGINQSGGGSGSAEDRSGQAFYKTRLCHAWQAGKCNYGDECKYAHGETDMQRPASDRKDLVFKGALYKTRPCFEFRDTGTCKLGDRCSYAHGDHELRPDRGTIGSRSGGKSAPSDVVSPLQVRAKPPAPPPGPRPPPRPPAPTPEAPTLPAASSAAPPASAPPGPPPQVSYTDRIRAMCVLMGVGTISASDLPAGAMAAAIASVKDGTAWAPTNYTNALQPYLTGT